MKPGGDASPLPVGGEIEPPAPPDEDGGGRSFDGLPPRPPTRLQTPFTITSTSGGSTSSGRGRFYALGNLGQYIYVAADADTVIVRLGRG
ncbi:MAG: hypothetical protein ACRDHO_04570, partial [Actinomycetota bacterium]